MKLQMPLGRVIAGVVKQRMKQIILKPTDYATGSGGIKTKKTL